MRVYAALFSCVLFNFLNSYVIGLTLLISVSTILSCLRFSCKFFPLILCYCFLSFYVIIIFVRKHVHALIYHLNPYVKLISPFALTQFIVHGLAPLALLYFSSTNVYNVDEFQWWQIPSHSHISTEGILSKLYVYIIYYW